MSAAHFGKCALGVAATACLVVSNKALLQRLPSRCAPEALTLLHNLISIIATRMCCPAIDRSKVVDRRWLLAGGFVCMAAVLSSNLTLQFSSVTFQQLARTAIIPASALADFVLHKKVVNALQLEHVALLMAGLCIAATGDVAAGALGILFATVSCLTAITANMVARRASAESSLTPVELMYHVAPWTFAIGAVVFAAKVAAQSQPWSLVRSLVPLAMDQSVAPGAALVIINGGLSFGVQYLSTWAMTHCSYTGYAVLGQAKTAGSVMLSAAVLAPVSAQTWCGLVLTLVAACAFTLGDRPDQTSAGGGSSDDRPSTGALRSEGACARAMPCARRALTISVIVFAASTQVGSSCAGEAPRLGVFRHQAGTKGQRDHASSRAFYHQASTQGQRDNATARHGRPRHMSNHSKAMYRQLQEVTQSRKYRTAKHGGSWRVSFIIMAPSTNREEVRTCGGCLVLVVLAETLRAFGHQVRIMRTRAIQLMNFSHEWCNTMSKDMWGRSPSTPTVVVYPESFPYRCPCDTNRYVHVTWLLRPLGVGNQKLLDEGLLQRRCAKELIFSYGKFHPAAAVPVPFSNLLQVMSDPSDDDRFRLWQYPPLPREGTVFMLRKAKLLHGEIQVLHESSAMELKRSHSFENIIHAFRTHTYFVCYDPASYYAWIAAMLGCITIIHPIANMTKREWLLSSGYTSGYMDYYNLTDVFGIAWGWDEVPYANSTLHLVRDQLWAIKEFAHSVTVPRFVRDVRRAAKGKYNNFEGAILSHDLYPAGWWSRETAAWFLTHFPRKWD